MGLTVTPVKAQALEAAQGATDFGEYFTYFSFFLMVSALLLTGLFFKLGIEQRTKEIGVLRALGFRRRGSARFSCWKGPRWPPSELPPAPRPLWPTELSSCWASAPGGSTR